MSSKTLECLPIGICSWNYEITDGAENYAVIKLTHFGERGSITANGEQFTIHTPSIFHSRWTLNQGVSSIFSANKMNLFTRTVEICAGSDKFELKGVSPFTREMILQGAGISCILEPQHPFTRRATISGTWDDFRLVAFGFWLTAMSWRRASQSS